MSEARALVIGFGNPGRGDDGLGPALVERLETLALAGVQLEADYLLAPEYAAAMADRDVVVFVDASVRGDGPFSFDPVTPRHDSSFSSHGMSPSELLGLAESMAGRAIPCYLLGVRGTSFEPFTESLSAGAQSNLEQALEFLVVLLQNCANRSEFEAVRVVNRTAREGK